MKTIFCVVILVIFGLAANFLHPLAMVAGGLPGVAIAGTPSRRSLRQFKFGSVVSALGQSFINLTFTAIVVSWTIKAAHRDDVIGFLLWPFAFLAVMLPTFRTLIQVRVEASELEYGSAHAEGMHLTFLLTLIGFFVFALAPASMSAIWGWIPFMSK